jgi:hypothetical protein
MLRTRISMGKYIVVLSLKGVTKMETFTHTAPPSNHTAPRVYCVNHVPSFARLSQ